MRSLNDSYKKVEIVVNEGLEEIVGQLNISGKEMEKMKDEILSSMESLSSIAEENSAAKEQVSASMEEQTASVEEIAGASDELANLAEKLQSIIMNFKV